MKLTFGIVTNTSTQHYLNEIILSIINQCIEKDNYEIIIVGGYIDINIYNVKCNIRWFSFDETVKKGWITKKKNIITNEARGEVIVYLHDYLKFDKEWYKNWCDFGWDWDIAINRIETNNGKRAIDWMGLPTDNKYGNVLLPYNYTNIKGMYIPGNFWLAKKDTMLKYPLDERLSWGEAEDIEWSKRVLGGNEERNEWLRNLTRRNINEKIDETGINTIYKCNPLSKVSYIKPYQPSFDFLKEYDMHSGDNSRPIGFKKEDYEYLKYRG